MLRDGRGLGDKGHHGTMATGLGRGTSSPSPITAHNESQVFADSASPANVGGDPGSGGRRTGARRRREPIGAVPRNMIPALAHARGPPTNPQPVPSLPA